MDNPPLPTADEIAELSEAVRRDPLSDAFVRLGECMLTLGRPREAIEVGARGLKANPSSIRGRMMVARAFVMLHQWKEAQAELLKVVKNDRNNGAGFRLLGEVLLRRGDYERALPVLQHAQNLSPADPSVLTLLRCARSGHPPEPPPPLPTPRSPVPSQRRPPPSKAPPPPPPPMRASSFDDAPTNVAGPEVFERLAAQDAGAALGRVDLDRREVVARGPEAPSERFAQSVRDDYRGRDEREFGAIQHHRPPAPEDPLAPLGHAPPPGPPVGGHEQMPVRPRLLPTVKPKDVAQASLRESVAVGEQYLNNLLLAGLLDVPNVRVGDIQVDAMPGKRWGRSMTGTFIVLFVLLFAGIAGAGGWYWYSQKQTQKEITAHLDKAASVVESGDYEDLTLANAEVRLALQLDKDSVYSLALLAEVTSLSTFLYGEFNPAEIEHTVGIVAAELEGPTTRGYRELVVARAASTLATLDSREGDAEDALAGVRRDLSGWLETSPDDLLARWLLGRALLAAGDRKEAAVEFERAHAAGEGPVLATIDLANVRLDEERFDEARALFDKALERSPKHALAFVGRSLTRSERRAEAGEAMSDINVGLAQAQGIRLDAWRQLALAYASYVLQDYEAFGKALDQCVNLTDPRFMVRVGLGRILQGRVIDAAKARVAIRWYASDPQPHPLVIYLDAELALAQGLPSEALKVVEGRSGMRAAWIRGRALFDLAQYEEALASFEEALVIAPGDADIAVWAQAATMLAKRGDERAKADQELDRLGRSAKSKAVKYIHSVALAGAGEAKLALSKLEQSVEDVSTEFPNHLAYRSYVALAEFDVDAGAPDKAAERLEKALEINPGYLPARDLMGTVLVGVDPNAALTHLTDVIDAGVATAAAELAYARLLAGSSDASTREAAVAAITRARDKGASIEALQAAIEAVDPALFEQLGVPVPK